MLFPRCWTGAAVTGPGRRRGRLLLAGSSTLSLSSLHPDGPARSSRASSVWPRGGKMGSRTRGERHTPEDRDAQTSWRQTHGEGDPSTPGDTYPNTQGEGHIHTNPRGDTQGHTEKPTLARQPSALPHDSWRESRGAHDLILATSDLLPSHSSI
ncbi:ras-related protein Rab-9A isoform X2 [Mesoplodon densirostris]|uniref:ras-related protein Rab-9A isoform X2 n=1 Tax=Mesoplodon densirostris TaxID=48708 RepID=UPI0028DC3415|nr:ras-related protein Rab-9A isoform X2 [Mesoplodon densirostris]